MRLIIDLHCANISKRKTIIKRFTSIHTNIKLEYLSVFFKIKAFLVKPKNAFSVGLSEVIFETTERNLTGL